MQTFLPYEDFPMCASRLDPTRLGNQFYREGLTLLRGGWPNHPAARMWMGHRWWLACYLDACGRELRVRGFDYPEHLLEVRKAKTRFAGREWKRPWWLGDPYLHASHRSNLLRKDPHWYGQWGWTEPDNLPYMWPDPDDPIPRMESELLLATLKSTAPAGAFQRGN